MARLLHTLTDASASRWGKFAMIVVWIAAVAVCSAFAPPLASVYDNTNTQAIPASDDSQVAQRLLLEKFPTSRGTLAILVLSDPSGLSADDRARSQTISDWLVSSEKPSAVGQVVSIYTVPQAASQLVSADGTTMTMLVNLNGAPADPALSDSVLAIRAHIADTTQGSTLRGHVTGPAGVVADSITIFSSADIKLLLATIGLVLVLLLVVYRSPILALLPLLAVGLALQVADALLAIATKNGLFPVSQQASSIATVLLFGAGTDYSIFIASRFREELRRTPDKHAAMRTTMRAVGEAITSSAGTVILALLTLLLATLGIYSSLGPTLAAAIAVMLLAGLTLVPALLVWFGRAAYWPFVPQYSPDSLQPPAEDASAPRGLWGRVGAWTAKGQRRRVFAVLFSLALLLVLAAGDLGIDRSFNFLTSFRVATDATTGYDVLQQHFPAGTLAPTTVLLQLHGDAPDVYTHLAQLDAVTAALAQVPGVAVVRGPTRPDGQPPTLDPATLQAAIATLPASLKAAIRAGGSSTGTPCAGPACAPTDPALAATIAAFAASTPYVSPDDTTVQLSVIFADDPYALPAINRIAPLRDAARSAVTIAGLGDGAGTSAEVHVGGQTSLLADTQAGSARDTLLIVPAVLALVGVVLALLLRSLIAPLYLLGAVTLNFFAALGACSFVFERLEGQDGLYYAIPLYTFIFLVALGADYTIFLMSRVREEAARRGLQAAVPVAVGRTGGVITSAGLILAGTFAVLTTLPLTLPLTLLYQFGVCVAAGVLLDTFVVRGLLVPGIVLLLGRWNWWPGYLPAPDATLLSNSAGHQVPHG